MLGHSLALIVMASGAASTVWQQDGSAKITVTFDANDPANPFPQGNKLLKKASKEACEGKGKPEQIRETVVTGISMAGGKPQVSMSGTYACK